MGSTSAAKSTGVSATAELAVASTCSKLVATAGTYPYQVIRSCMQQRAVVGYDRVRLEGTLATAARIWREEGGRGFYRGIWAHMLRSTPQATITLMLYEYAMRALTLVRPSGGEYV